MRFEFIVSAEVERVQGKFASRDEIEEQIVDALIQVLQTKLNEANAQLAERLVIE